MPSIRRFELSTLPSVESLNQLSHILTLLVPRNSTFISLSGEGHVIAAYYQIPDDTEGRVQSEYFQVIKKDGVIDPKAYPVAGSIVKLGYMQRKKGWFSERTKVVEVVIPIFKIL